jgi:hypothetical protein
VNDIERVAAMAQRLERAARHVRLLADPDQTITRAFRAAMQPRTHFFSDLHHADALHPGRTGLILLEDVQVSDTAEVAAAILFDSLQPGLMVSDEIAAEAAGERAAALLQPMRLLDDPAERLERLVSESDAVRRAALAERLDHARHLHLRPRETWVEFHDQIRHIYLPAAQRTHAVLEWRFAWWLEMFESRFLRT